MKKPLLYPKLAWQGIRKNAETYLPYLLMGILMVGVSYIMNYLTRPALMGALSMGGTTLMVLQMGKIVISVFSVIFLYYCNSFLIRRRMKEFGLYNILGMGKGNIARVMLWETLLTALLVFAGGLLLGLSLSRLVEMALINLLHADYTVPMELFYPDGVTWVLLLFGGIYVLLLLANLLRMRLSNPVALLKSENTGEKPPKANWFFGLIGLLILLSAYYVAAVSQSPLEALIFFFIAVLMVIVATYLLLVSGSVTLCRMLRRNKRYYYQTRHFISVSAMAYRMKRNGAGMATICILCTMVLVILTSTVCLYGGTDSMVDAICPQGHQPDDRVGGARRRGELETTGRYAADGAGRDRGNGLDAGKHHIPARTGSNGKGAKRRLRHYHGCRFAQGERFGTDRISAVCL